MRIVILLGLVILGVWWWQPAVEKQNPNKPVVNVVETNFTFTDDDLQALPKAEENAIAYAYKAIPHRRTIYERAESPLDKNVSRYLEAVFSLTDRALVLRMNLLGGSDSVNAYQPILADLQKIKVPKEAREVHELIILAVMEQQKVFISQEAGDMQHKKAFTNSSHGKLGKSYSMLMKTFPESQHNQQAFFDYLCALDFM